MFISNEFLSNLLKWSLQVTEINFEKYHGFKEWKRKKQFSFYLPLYSRFNSRLKEFSSLRAITSFEFTASILTGYLAVTIRGIGLENRKFDCCISDYSKM